MGESQTVEAEQAARVYWSAEGWLPGGVIRDIDYAQESGGLDPMFAGIKIVDTDTHIVEPPTLFTARAPVGMKDKMPYVKRGEDGVDRWFIGDRNCGSLGGNVIRKDNNKLLGRLAFPTLEESHPGGHELKPRLQAMDDMGVYAQICYQNSGITQAGTLMRLENGLGTTLLSVFNDFYIEWQNESGQRIFPMAHLPIWDRNALMREAHRCIDMGIKGFTLPDMPENIGLPSFTNEYWTPFLELCSDTGIPINFHLNAAIDPESLTWGEFGFEQRLAVISTMFSIGNAATLGNWMVSGLLDKHPGLKFGLIESGMSWVAYALEALEHQFDEMLPAKAHMLHRRPFEYFRDHFWCTFWFEKIGPKKLLEDIGVDKVMFETDFPHPTSLYPGVQSHLKDVLGGYSHEIRKKVLQDNAVQLYKLPF